MIDYDKVIEDVPGLKRFGCRGSLAMVEHDSPLSITQEEFKFIYNYIVRQGYHSAYECATGFGVSACAIGMAMRHNHGHLETIDAYIEETVNQPSNYHGREKDAFQNADGYQMAKKLRTYFDIERFITFHVGNSPKDVPAILKDRMIDFAFIDAYHHIDYLRQDIFAVMPYLAKESCVMIHDAHTFDGNNLAEIASQLKMHYRTIDEIPSDQTYNIGVFVR